MLGPSHGGGWEIFSVPISLHQRQRKVSMPGSSVRARVRVQREYAPLSPPTPAFCFEARFTGRKERWVIAIVTIHT